MLRRNVGVVFQIINCFQKKTVCKILPTQCKLSVSAVRNIKSVMEVLDLVRLTRSAHSPNGVRGEH